MMLEHEGSVYIVNPWLAMWLVEEVCESISIH